MQLIQELLNKLYQNGFVLRVVNGQLTCLNLKGDKLTNEFREMIRVNKKDIVEYLSHQPLQLSYSQQRLYFIDQYDQHKSFAYNSPFALRITGKLDKVALTRSFNLLIARHEILRTIFTLQDESPVQVVLPPYELKINIDKLSENNIHKKIQELIRMPFHLDRLPLLRAELLIINNNEHVLFVNQHHIITDGWSIEIFIEELFYFYKKIINQEVVDHQQYVIQYADYVCWQRAWLNDERIHHSVKYWKEQLHDFETLHLPADYERSNELSYEGQTHSIEIPQKIMEFFKKYSKDSQTSMFIAMLTTINILLSKYAAQNDVIIGTPIANRDFQSFEKTLGFFVNTLALRNIINDQISFIEFAAAVKINCLRAYEHQHLPFEQLLEMLEIKRDTSRHPIFQILYSFINNQQQSLSLKIDDLAIEPFLFDYDIAKFDLAINIYEHDHALTCSFLYNSKLFKEETIKMMSECYINLLNAIMVDPHESIKNLSLLDHDVINQLLKRGTPQKKISVHKTVCHYFKAQVLREPEAIAVSFAGRHMSYRELDESSNQLARHLLKYYAQNLNKKLLVNTLIGIALSPSVELIVTILGVLKVRCGYLPLAIDYPAERLSFMIRDANVEVVISNSEHLEQNKALQSLPHLLLLDKEAATIINNDACPLEEEPDPQDLAYVIYTSGSTGVPKGVLIPHKNIVRLFLSTEPYFQFDHHDVWTLFHSFAFDFSVWEIWGSLIYGGRLVIVPYWCIRSPHDFYKLLLQEKVTVLNQTYSAFKELIHVDKENNTRLNQLRYVIFGGEEVKYPGLKSWVNKYDLSKTKLINMYGITETTVHVTYYVIDMKNIECGRPTIGRPLPDLGIFILDPSMHLVPIGVKGEMYVSGAGLAKGYLGNQKLTHERFINSPFDADVQLYRTGDLARYLPDGNIEYLGRIDFQIKIRGHRIEIGEIEAAIIALETIKDCRVLMRDDQGETKLFAYVIKESDSRLNNNDIRYLLGQKLPLYMLPSEIIEMTAFPLTKNGKLDLKLLPSTGIIDRSSNKFELPRNPIEVSLKGIFEQVLKKSNISIHDNFFNLGGDSILAISVVAKAKNLNIALTIKELFLYQTVAHLSENYYYRKQVDETEIKETQPFELINEEIHTSLASDVEDAYPLTTLQLGMVYHSEHDQSPSVYHDILSFEVAFPFDKNRMKRTLQKLLDEHSVLRTSFNIAQYHIPIQCVHKHIKPTLVIKDLSSFSTQEQSQIIQDELSEEKQQSFMWKKPSLIRFKFYILNNELFFAMISFHHAILDGWSFASLITQLIENYQNDDDNKNEHRIPSRNLFRDYVLLEKNAIASDQQQMFWQQKLLTGTAAKLPFPLHKSVENIYGVSQYELTLDQSIIIQLKKLSHELQVSIKHIFLAAHLRILAVLAGSDQAMTGLVFNGRPEIEGSDACLGLFLNTLPFYVEQNGVTWIDFIKSVFNTELELYPYRRYPLSEIQKMFGSFLFEVVFNFTHFHIYQKLEQSQINSKNTKSEFYEETNFPLAITFGVDPVSDMISISFNYMRSRFSESEIKKIANYYLYTLTLISENPQAHYKLQSILPNDEFKALLGHEYEQRMLPNNTIHELFEQMVVKHPLNIAIYYEDITLNYAQLNHRANNLACEIRTLYQHLYHQPLEGEIFIGVCLERGIDVIVSVLAILKAGGIYVPMSLSDPEERLYYIIKDAHIKLLISNTAIISTIKFTQQHSAILDIDLIQNNLDGYSDNNLNLPIANDQAAYVIYTSGSTGQPKGVLLKHQGLMNLILANIELFQLHHLDKVLQFSNISFDASIWEIFLTLISGATLYIPSEVRRTDVDALGNYLLQHNITTAILPPAILQIFPKISLPNLMRLIVGGDKCDLKTIQFWSKGRMLYNAYGPTEATVCATLKHYHGEELAIANNIGKPIANVRTYVLDQNRQLLPYGVVGELYLGGVGIAVRYLNQPKLSNEKFIANPFISFHEQNNILYKTGDLVRRLENDDLEFVGRIDYQVKMRGFRIELEEIENVLMEHEQIKYAAVIVHDKDQNKLLIAYFTAHHKNQIASEVLKAYLAHKLPSYMQPTVYIELEQMPLTSSGKVNRHHLPLPDMHAMLAKEYVAPQTDIEQQLVEIWKQVLKIQKIGVTDVFFELGGDSLNGTQIASKIRDQFNIHFPIATIFECPSIKKLAIFIEKNIGSLNAPTIIKMKHFTKIPLSYAQQRLWFIHQYQNQENHLHNIVSAIRLKGSLNIMVMEKAIRAIIFRHQSFRTIFKIDSFGSLYQEIISDQELPDLLLETALALETDIGQLIEKELYHNFILSEPPLFRFKLWQLSSQEHLLILNQHHIISDGWSFNIFLKEFSVIYNHLLNSEDNKFELPELSIQYTDFSVWQREYIEKNSHVLLQYWRQKLQNFEPLMLPVNQSRPVIQTQNGDVLEFILDESLFANIKNFAINNNCSLYMVLLTAFYILLSHYCRQSDVVVGSPIANRNYSQFENIMGFFVNTLALRVNVNSHTVLSLLEEVRKTCLEAYQYQDLPFEYIVDKLNLLRDQSRTPVFQVMFVLQNLNQQLASSLHGLEMMYVDYKRPFAEFDLTLSLFEQECYCKGEWEFNTDLYYQATLENMTQHYLSVLRQMIATPQQKVAKINLLSEQEYQRIVYDWNRTDVAFPLISIQKMFEKQVLETPHHIAVTFNHQALTYVELNQKANQLARYIIKQYEQSMGKQLMANTLIPICVHRNLEMIVSVLAVLKTGTAYVPIDPNYPPERIHFILKDINAPLVLMHKNLIEQYSSDGFFKKNPIKTIDVEQDYPENIENLDFEHPLSDLAYVLYTSGTTGTPKGVMITLKSLGNYVCHSHQAYHLNAQDRIAQYSSFSFDIFCSDWSIALTRGACLHIVPDAIRIDPHQLIAWINQHGITYIELPTAIFHLLYHHNLNQLRKLRILKIGGEKLEFRAKKEWAFDLINGYGPTETTVECTTTKVKSDDSPIVIGRPISNVKAYILDQALQPVPVGVCGELYISGACLAQGYLNQIQLTEQLFTSNLFITDGNKEYSLMYRTGDLVRWLDDGHIEFLGRADDQIKIRGFRIEPSEIELALLKMPQITQCFVTSHQNAEEQSIAAYYVINENSVHDNFNVDDIRDYLFDLLPEYMLPSFYIKLDSLPLLENGKIDRKALPLPQRPIVEQRILPNTKIEQQIWDVWHESLNHDQIGIHDSFFAVGGNSILIMKVLFKLNSLGYRDLTAIDLFKYQTISLLAKKLENISNASPVLTNHSLNTETRKALFDRLKSAKNKRNYEKNSIE